MPLFILTQTNVDAAKASLRASLPEIRSGHLTEALASGLGFNSNAALRAAITSETGNPFALTDADAERFSDRLATLSYEGVPHAPFIVAMREDVLNDTPYAYFKQGDCRANSLHFSACQSRNRPMMMVKVGRRYAELEWDCVTITSDRPGHLTDEQARTMFSLFQARTKGAPGKPYFCGNAFTGTIKRLLPETARQLAEEYFKLLYLPLRQSPSTQT